MFKEISTNLPLIARVLISFLFIFASLSNLAHAKLLITDMAQKGVPLTNIVFYSGVIVQLIAGTCLMLGYKVYLAVPVLILFVVLATLIFHDFWHAKGAFYRIQCLSFVTNISTIGALLLLLAYAQKT